MKKLTLQSKPQVDRFLAALQEFGGDETEAHAKAWGKPKKKETKSKTNGATPAGTNTPATSLPATTETEKPSSATKPENGRREDLGMEACTEIDVTKGTKEKIVTKSETPTVPNAPSKSPPTTKRTKKPSSATKPKKVLREDLGFDPPPKRPNTTYLMYTISLRPKVTAENPNANPQEISRMLGAIYRAAPKEELDALKVEYTKQLEAYQKEMKAWELRNPGKKSKKQKKRGRDNASEKAVPKAATKSPNPNPKKKAKAASAEPDWWEVEAFRDRRINSSTGQEEFLIKWKGCPESSNTWEPASNLNAMDDAREWWKHETERRNNRKKREQRIQDSMKRLGLDGNLSDDESDGDAGPVDSAGATILSSPTAVSGVARSFCKRREAPVYSSRDKTAAPLVEDTTWNWDDAAQVNFRAVRRVSVHEPNARETVTEARINGTPLVLTGHVGWANFALRWLCRRADGAVTATTCSEPVNGPAVIDQGNTNEAGDSGGHDVRSGGVVPMGVSKEGSEAEGNAAGTKNETTEPGSVSSVPKVSNGSNLVPNNGDGKPSKNTNSETPLPSAASTKNEELVKEDGIPKNGESQPTNLEMSGDSSDNKKTEMKYSNKPLDLSDPSWYLDIQAMSDDIGDEEVPVVRKNYNESKPISGNILASKFFEAGWKINSDKATQLSPRKRRRAALYLHQWQFPLSVDACKKLCHQNAPLPNNILGEDLLKYWLDRVKMDSPLQYLFMGNADTMSKIHRDNGGLAISIAPITGVKECVLVHRDDGHACLYNNQAPLDPEDIDLNGYPLLPHARIWKTSIQPGEILLMPHGTYHQCRNLTPCLSYSRFHLDGVNLRAFLHSMMDGDAPELHQDEVLWNATRELIDTVDKASDEKRSVDEALVKAVDALRALRNIAKEVTRKLHVRETVKGPDPATSVISSSVHIDGDAEIWQSLVDDVDMCLHEFRYRFNKKIPSFKRRRSIGKRILALPALPFRGKSKPSQAELTQGKNEPVVAFECPTDRGFLALPKAPAPVSGLDREKVDEAVTSIVVGDDMVVRIEGRKCPARVTEVMPNARVAWVTFEDLPSLYNDFVPYDLLRTPSVGGSCLSQPSAEEIKPGKVFVCLMGKDEYRAIVQHVKTGRFFRSKLDFGNGFTIDKLIDTDSILSVESNHSKRHAEDDEKTSAGRRKKLRKTVAAPAAEETPITTTTNSCESNAQPNLNNDKKEATTGEIAETKAPMDKKNETEQGKSSTQDVRKDDEEKKKPGKNSLRNK